MVNNSLACFCSRIHRSAPTCYGDDDFVVYSDRRLYDILASLLPLGKSVDHL